MPLACECEQLTLFDGGPDVGKLRRLVAVVTEGARADSTRVAYGFDWKAFAAWCRAAGRSALPATEETLCLFLVAEVEGHAVATVTRRAAAIVDRHLRAGHASPLGVTARDVLRGMRRDPSAPPPAAKAALRPEELRSICVKLWRERSTRASYAGLRVGDAAIGGGRAGSCRRALRSQGFAGDDPSRED